MATVREIKIKEFFDANGNLLEEEYYIDNILVYENKLDSSNKLCCSFHNSQLISDKETEALTVLPNVLNFKTVKKNIKSTSVAGILRTIVREIEIKDYYHSNGGLIKSNYYVNNQLLAYKIFKQQSLVYKQTKSNLPLNHEEHLVYRKIFIKDAKPDI